jgi:chorismate dehydratase
MAMKVSVSVLSYANALPFVYGILHSDLIGRIELLLDISPAQCAERLVKGEVDLALMPAIEIARLPYNEIISNYCVGTNGPVKTVLLVSNTEIEKVKGIYLDSQSRTSIALAKILAEKFWRIEPQWHEADRDFDFQKIPEGYGAVVIGDKNFNLKYKYTIDLAEAWRDYTNLPFVLVCWVTSKKLDAAFQGEFDNALRYGVNHIGEAVKSYEKLGFPHDFIQNYLSRNISFALDDQKMKAMQLFFRLAAQKKLISEPVKPFIWKQQTYYI